VKLFLTANMKLGLPAVHWIVTGNANAGEWDGTGVSVAVKPWLLSNPQQFMRQQVKVSNTLPSFFLLPSNPGVYLWIMRYQKLRGGYNMSSESLNKKSNNRKLEINSFC